MLVHVDDGAPQRLRIRVQRQALVIQFDHAVIAPFQPAQHAQQRAFAGAVGAREHVGAAGLDVQPLDVEQQALAVGLAQRVHR